MSFELSFSEDFFTGEYGQARPCSIFEAAERLSADERRQLALDLALWRFPHNLAGRDSRYWPQSESFPWDIVDVAREVDTCDQLASPVAVFLDAEGRVGLEVCGNVSEEE